LGVSLNISDRSSSKRLKFQGKYQASFCTQVSILFKRNYLYVIRNPLGLLAMVFSSIFNGMICAGIFHGLAGKKMIFEYPMTMEDFAWN